MGTLLEDSKLRKWILLVSTLAFRKTKTASNQPRLTHCFMSAYF